MGAVARYTATRILSAAPSVASGDANTETLLPHGNRTNFRAKVGLPANGALLELGRRLPRPFLSLLAQKFARRDAAALFRYRNAQENNAAHPEYVFRSAGSRCARPRTRLLSTRASWQTRKGL
jgi:hypothetical protein